MLGLTVAKDQLQIFTINGVMQPGAGTFLVGMCGSSPNAANWNYNDWGSHRPQW